MIVLIVILVIIGLFILPSVVSAIVSAITETLCAFFATLVSAIAWIVMGSVIVCGAVALCFKGGAIGRIMVAISSLITIVYFIWGDDIRMIAVQSSVTNTEESNVNNIRGAEVEDSSKHKEDITWNPTFESLTVDATNTKIKMYNERLEELKASRKKQLEEDKAKHLKQFNNGKMARSEKEAGIQSRYRGEAAANESVLKLFCLEEDTYNASELRQFAIKESPVLWETIQRLKADLQYRDVRIDEYRKAAKRQNVDLNFDPEHLNMCHSRNALARSLRRVYGKLHSAYLLKRRHDATMLDTELTNAMKKATTDGIEEASRIMQRLKELYLIKELDETVEGVK